MTGDLASGLSKLELLPTEVLGRVIDDLDVSRHSDLTRLLRSSGFLKQRLEPELYSRTDVQHQAMRWACISGNTDIIRLLLVSYHMPPSTVQFLNLCPRSTEPEIDNNDVATIADQDDARRTLHVSTLYLAAKHQHARAFKLLLELGARLDDPSLQLKRSENLVQVRQLVNCIFSRGTIREAPDLARSYFQFGLDLQAKAVGQGPDIYWPLIRAIKANAPEDIIQALLDRGAYPSGQVYGHFGYKECITPLSAAVLANSPNIFRLLLAFRTEEVNGRDLIKPSRRALHRPVFACAYALAVAPSPETHASVVAMLRQCVEAGADLNAVSPLLGTKRSSLRTGERHKEGWQWLRIDEYYNATALHLFLSSVTAWERIPKYKNVGTPEEGRGGISTVDNPKWKMTKTAEPEPVDGLRALIALGAIPNPANAESDTSMTKEEKAPRTPYGPLMHCRSLSPLELLLEKWGTYTLAAYPSCVSIVEKLLSAGAAKDSQEFLLCKYTIPIQSAYTAIKMGAIVGARNLAGLLVKDVPFAEASRVLFVYVVTLVRSEYILGLASRRVIEGLVDCRGADVNKRFSPSIAGIDDEDSEDGDMSEGGTEGDTEQGHRKEDGKQDDETALHHTCWVINRLEKLDGRDWLGYSADSRSPNHRRNILRLLLSKGADPGILVSGKTAADVLLDGLEELSEDSQGYLFSLAGLVRGEDKEPVMIFNTWTDGWDACVVK
ncbi:hypothetical protein GQ53DRAFT_815078 [Thozetella sp. PMI_491]|nr:hypothetical protein GQ53DRAFT_815078 [Thozetella sp. PMI_491]